MRPELRQTRRLSGVGTKRFAPNTVRRYLFFLKPVIAALLAFMILGQDLTVAQGLAILVITSSVFAELFLGKAGKASPVRNSKAETRSTSRAN